MSLKNLIVCLIFLKVCKGFTNTAIFKPLFCHPWSSQRIKKWADIFLFDALTIVWKLMCFEEAPSYNLFLYPLFASLFWRPWIKKRLETKKPVYSFMYMSFTIVLWPPKKNTKFWYTLYHRLFGKQREYKIPLQLELVRKHAYGPKSCGHTRLRSTFFKTLLMTCIRCKW